jgi:hypothetical protein
MTDVKVQDKTPRKEYTASSGQTVFPYDFVIFDEDDLEVFQNGTKLTITTDYTISGVLDENGGDVTLTSGATTGDEIIISREVPIERTTQYTTGGDFRAEVIGREQSREIAIAQQLARDIDRVLTFDVTATGITAGTLPEPQDDRTILFDGTTGSMKIGPTAGNIENAETFANQAETAKNDAEAALDAFDDRNLGAKVSDPTVDNDGDPLQTGTYYFNTTNNVVKVYNGTTWQSVTSPFGTSDIVDGAVTNVKLADDIIDGYSAETTIADDDTLPFYDDSAGENKKIAASDLLPDASETVKGVVEKATQAEVESGTADKFVDAETLRNAIGFSEFFESGETAITLDSKVSVAHGLSTKPILFQAVLRCKTAEFGYAVGDEMDATNHILREGTRPHLYGFWTGVDSANVFTVFGEVLQVMDTSGDVDNLSPSNWRLVIRAWA